MIFLYSGIITQYNIYEKYLFCIVSIFKKYSIGGAAVDLKQLGYFVAIVEEGSISAAAKQLHISQPPLSAQLRRLEEELGVPLIERGPRHVTPTEAGRALYRQAKRLLLLADAARDEVAQLAGGVRGVLRLGVISSCGPTLFTAAFEAFCRRYPELRFEMREGNTYELLELLRAGAIEVAVLRTPFPAEGLDCRAVAPEPLTAAARPGFFAGLGPGPLSPRQLAGLPLAYYRRFEALLEGAFRRVDAPLRARCVVDDARTALAWARAGLAAALVPRSAVALCPGALEVREIAAPELVTSVTVATRGTAPLSAGAKAFVALFPAHTEK